MQYSFNTDQGNLYCMILIENDLDKVLLENIVPGMAESAKRLALSFRTKLKNGEELKIQTLTAKDIVSDDIFRQAQGPKKK